MRGLGRFVVVGALVGPLMTAPGCAGTGSQADAGLPEEVMESLGRAEMVALWVFQDEDCAGRRTAVERLNELSAEDGVVVIGVRVNAARAIGETGATFTVLEGPEASAEATRLARAMGYTQTPLLIGMDRAGRVRYAAPVPGASDAQEEAVLRLKELAERVRANGPGGHG